MKWNFALLFSLFSLVINAQDYKLEGNEVKTAKQVIFETGSDKLKPESMAALETIKQYLADKSYISLLRVECHTDNSGDANAGQLLTEKRALAICKKLVEMGVDCRRLIAVGFGNTKPVADNSTPEGRAQNRRVSFLNAALRNRLIGGMPADGGGKVAGDVCN
ncbi:MAG: OmpA family protein [Ferruginibacter sp.]|nr:OmpA family protein [Chitinophagaceae bacterium]MBP6287211.1 OmpA family protein [Ferruginibacter sp.]